MRQNIKDVNFYKRHISDIESVENRIVEKIKGNSIPTDRMQSVFDLRRSNRLVRTILKFTFGEPIADVKNEFNKVIEYTNENWVGLWTLKLSADNIYQQYTLSAYDEMLWMLSLGYLLDINDTDFRKMVALIDLDGVRDFLFEFIISAKIKDRKPIDSESYRDFFGIPEVFEKLRQAITETDKTKSEKLVKDFITKDWYKNHKGAGWYNSHKSKHDTYFGYWSFETAAIVKIMDLDDSSFIDCQYYPKDLVHL